MEELPFHLVMQLSSYIVLLHGIFAGIARAVEMNDGNGPCSLHEIIYDSLPRKEYTIFFTKVGAKSLVLYLEQSYYCCSRSVAPIAAFLVVRPSSVSVSCSKLSQFTRRMSFHKS